METRATVSGSSSYGQACMQCYKAKCRCIARPDGAGCERCFRLKKQCQPSESSRRRSVQNRDTGAQIARLEGRIEALTSMLESVIKNNTGGSAGLPQPLDEPLSTANGTFPLRDSVNAILGLGPTPSSDPSPPVSSRSISFHAGASSLSLSPPLYEPTPDEAQAHLELFRTRMLPCFPFIHISPNQTAQQLRQSRPFLFRAIVMVTTPLTQQKLARTEGLLCVLAKSAVVENQSSLDLLQSILTYITWSTDPFVRRTGSLSRMIMLASSMVSELQLARPPPPPDAHIIATMTPGLGETDRDTHETSGSGLLEQHRSFLACFVLSSMRTDAMKWTPQMKEALRMISMNKDCPSDESFAFQVRLQLLAQRVAQVREQHEADYDEAVTTSTTPPAPIALYLNVLQGKLQELKTSLSPHLQQIDMITAHTHYVDLCINEGTSLATSNAPVLATSDSTTDACVMIPRFDRLECLWRCLHAAKAWLDVFYKASPAAYMGFPFFYWFQLVRCIIILKHLSTFNDPAWDCQAVYNTVDFTGVLEWLAEKTDLASQEAAEQSDDDRFRKVSKMLRLSLAWINTRRKEAAQAMERPSSTHGDEPTLATTEHDVVNPDQAFWMNDFESGHELWFQDYFDWPPGTLGL